MDSGSAFSIIPHKSVAAPTGPCLVTADGTPLKCWGRRTCTVHTRTKKFTWSFLLAPVAFPIIGADFLCNFKLMVDVSSRRLVARGGQLTQLVPGKHASAAVVYRSHGGTPATGGGPLYTFSSHSGGTFLNTFTQQLLPKKASGQLARRSSQEAHSG